MAKQAVAALVVLYGVRDGIHTKRLWSRLLQRCEATGEHVKYVETTPHVRQFYGVERVPCVDYYSDDEFIRLATVREIDAFTRLPGKLVTVRNER